MKCENEIKPCPIKYILDNYYKMDHDQPDLYVETHLSRMKPVKKGAQSEDKYKPILAKLKLPKEILYIYLYINIKIYYLYFINYL